MDCVICGRGREFDRIVVGHERGAVSGAICGPCEERALGVAEDAEGAECVFCEEEGAYAAPRWDTLVVGESGEGPTYLEYTIDPGTPRLCHEHYAAIANEDAVASGTENVEGRRATARE